MNKFASLAHVILGVGVFLALAVTGRGALPPEAQDAVNKGLVAQKQEDYLLAIRYFQDARRLAPVAPEVFHNLGEAESKIPGHELRAIAWLGAYLAASPNAPDSAAVKEQIAALDAKIRNDLSALIQIAQDAAGQVPQEGVHGTGVQIENRNEALTKVASLWMATGDFAAAHKLVDLFDPRSKDNSEAKIAAAQTKAGDFTGAQKTADMITEEGIKRDTEIALALAQAQDGDVAGERATFMLARNADAMIKVPYPYIQVESQRQIAEAQIKAGDMVGAQEGVALIDGDVKYAVDTVIATAQAKAGDFSDAQKTADLIEANIRDNHEAEIAIAEAQTQAGEVAEARTTLLNAQKTADLILNGSEWPERDIAAAQAKAGFIADANKTADLVRGPAGPASNPWMKCRVLIAIATAQAQNGDMAGARETFLSALKTHALEGVDDMDMKNETEGAITDALRAAVETLLKAGNFAGAQKIADLMPGTFDKSREENTIAQEQVKAGDIAGAQTTLLIAQQGVIPHENYGPAHDVVEARLNAGDFVGAQKIAELMASPDDKNQEVRAIADAQVNSGHIADAQTTLLIAKQTTIPNVISGAESDIAAAQLKSGDMAGALVTAGQIADVETESNAVRVIAEAKTKTGDFAGAQQTAELIRDEKISGNTEGAIVGAQANAGDFAGALRTAEMIADAESKGNAERIVAEAQMRAGAFAGAQAILLLAEKDAETVTDASVIRDMEGQVAKDQADARDIAGAQVTADLISDPENKSIALRIIATAQAGYKDSASAQATFLLAQKTAETITNANLKSYAESGIAEAQANVGDFAGALRTAELIVDARYKGRAQNAIASAQAKAGDLVGALKTAEIIADASSKGHAESGIADIQLIAGELAAAQKTADLITDSGWKNHTERAIADALAKTGDIVGAQKTAEFILDANMRSPVERAIVDAQVRARNFAEAKTTAGLIADANLKSQAQDAITDAEYAIAEAKAKSAATTNTGANSLVIIAVQPALVPAAQPVSPQLPQPGVSVSDWIGELDTLNTPLDLELANDLKTLPSSNPYSPSFDQLVDMAQKVIAEQTAIDQMLKRQTQGQTRQ